MTETSFQVVIAKNPLHGSQPCCGKGVCVTKWSHEPCYSGPPKMDQSQRGVLTKRGPLEEGMANHSNILALRTPWTVWKGKKIWHWKMHLPGQKVSSMLLGKSRGQLLIAPEKMNWLGQSGNDVCLWICLVVRVKSDVVKKLSYRKLKFSSMNQGKLDLVKQNMQKWTSTF